MSAKSKIYETTYPNLQKDDGTTPLFMAAQEGHSDIC